MSRKDTPGIATAADPFFEAALDRAIAGEIARLEREGHDKAAICQRSHEIEAEMRAKLQRRPAQRIAPPG